MTSEDSGLLTQLQPLLSMPRETLPQLGNLVNDFDFTQTPRQPLLLPVQVVVDPQPAAAPTPDEDND